MPLLCPTCNRAILSRRNPLCSFCQQPLPAKLLFTPAEIQRIEAEERERALARTLHEEKRAREAEKARLCDGGGGGGFIGYGFGGELLRVTKIPRFTLRRLMIAVGLIAVAPVGPTPGFRADEGSYDGG